MDKKLLRNKYLEKRNSIDQSIINKKSLKIFNKIKNSNYFKKARVVMFYVSFGSEINTQNMLKRLFIGGTNKIICVPVLKGDVIVGSVIDDFDSLDSKNNFGILEPSSVRKISKDMIDLVIVPGIVFDKKGFRIGYGKGYYDRFLENYGGYKMGICFKGQIISELPKGKYDVKVDELITE